MRSRSRGVSLALGPKPASDERGEHEEQRAERDQEHDGEDAHRLREEVAVAVERAGEVEAEHPRAPVRAERLGRDQRGEERERAADDERVVAVGDQVVGREVVGDHRKRDGEERRKKGDRERDRGQHLVAGAAPEPEHAPRGEDGQRQDRPGRALARAVVAAVAEVEELCVRSRRHVPAPRYTSSSVRPRGSSRRSPIPRSATASRTAS